MERRVGGGRRTHDLLSGTAVFLVRRAGRAVTIRAAGCVRSCRAGGARVAAEGHWGRERAQFAGGAEPRRRSRAAGGELGGLHLLLGGVALLGHAVLLAQPAHGVAGGVGLGRLLAVEEHVAAAERLVRAVPLHDALHRVVGAEAEFLEEGPGFVFGLAVLWQQRPSAQGIPNPTHERQGQRHTAQQPHPILILILALGIAHLGVPGRLLPLPRRAPPRNRLAQHPQPLLRRRRLRLLLAAVRPGQAHLKPLALRPALQRPVEAEPQHHRPPRRNLAALRVLERVRDRVLEAQVVERGDRLARPRAAGLERRVAVVGARLGRLAREGRGGVGGFGAAAAGGGGRQEQLLGGGHLGLEVLDALRVVVAQAGEGLGEGAGGHGFFFCRGGLREKKGPGRGCFLNCVSAGRCVSIDARAQSLCGCWSEREMFPCACAAGLTGGRA